MSARWFAVLLLLGAGCGSAGDVGAGSTAPVGATSATTTTTTNQLDPQVQLPATVPPLDGPATVWRVPALLPDPERLTEWAHAFGFTDDEIGAAQAGRVGRDTPDGSVLTIYEATGHWVFVSGPAGMYAEPGSCEPCADQPPTGDPDSVAAEQQARVLWQTLGIDLAEAHVTVSGAENVREVIASDDLDGVIVPRDRVMIGVDGHVLRATGSVDAAVPAGSVARLGLIEALNRFVHEPPSAGPETVPPGFDGTYRVTRATAGLVAVGEQLLVPSYEVALTDGRTITLLAIDPNDIPSS